MSEDNPLSARPGLVAALLGDEDGWIEYEDNWITARNHKPLIEWDVPATRPEEHDERLDELWGRNMRAERPFADPELEDYAARWYAREAQRAAFVFLAAFNAFLHHLPESMSELDVEDRFPFDEVFAWMDTVRSVLNRCRANVCDDCQAADEKPDGIAEVEEAVQALKRAQRRNAVLIPLMRAGGHKTVGDLLDAITEALGGTWTSTVGAGKERGR